MDLSSLPRWEGKFQILSLDGGGIKGLFSAAILAKLEEKCQVKITDHFDLITGTSTGGLIAIGLGLGMSPKELVQFYVNNGNKIFPNFFNWRSWFLHWLYRKYPQEPFKAILQDSSVFGEKRIGESKKRLVIPAYNLGKECVRLFKTPHHPRLKTDLNIPAWKVALATSAAPTYFPVCNHISKTRMIDGGIWANNPSMVGITEAISLLNVDLKQITVLSVGTTDCRTHRIKSLNNGGIFQWLKGQHLIDILMRGQSEGVNGQSKLLLGDEGFHRIDPTVPQGIYHLDKLTADELLAEAEDESLKFSDKFDSQFREHVAKEYTPYSQSKLIEM